MIEQIKKWMEDETPVSVIMKTHENGAEGKILSYDKVGIVLEEDTGAERIIPYDSIEFIRKSLCWDD